MKYKFRIWVKEELERFIVNNSDVIEAAIGFIFWEDYEVEYDRIPESVSSSLKYNEFKQVDIKQFIESFRKYVKSLSNVIDIIILPWDITFKGKDYIFAATHVPSKTIVLSIYRLNRTYDMRSYIDQDTLRRRVFKEVLHELGHLLGLEHCSDNRCVMSFSPDLKSLDEKLPLFCRDCVDKLKNMGYNISSSSGIF